MSKTTRWARMIFRMISDFIDVRMEESFTQSTYSLIEWLVFNWGLKKVLGTPSGLDITRCSMKPWCRPRFVIVIWFLSINGNSDIAQRSIYIIVDPEISSVWKLAWWEGAVKYFKNSLWKRRSLLTHLVVASLLHCVNVFPPVVASSPSFCYSR